MTLPYPNGRRPEPMAGQDKAQQDLAETDCRMAECEVRVARQAELVAALRAAGGDVAPSENLLATMKQSLAEIREEHRRLMLVPLHEETLPPAGPEDTSRS
jgi:uncharacterized coiled-coil protein SlyX